MGWQEFERKSNKKCSDRSSMNWGDWMKLGVMGKCEFVRRRDKMDIDMTWNEWKSEMSTDAAYARQGHVNEWVWVLCMVLLKGKKEWRKKENWVCEYQLCNMSWWCVILHVLWLEGVAHGLVQAGGYRWSNLWRYVLRWVYVQGRDDIAVQWIEAKGFKEWKRREQKD